MSWGAIAAGIGGLMTGFGSMQQGQDAQAMLSPGRIKANAAKFNPWLFGALESGDGGSYYAPGDFNSQGNYLDYVSGQNIGPGGSYQDHINQLVNNPGYMDPRMMNANLNMVNQAGAGMMQGMQGKIGAGGFEGGMADTFALANQAATNAARAGVFTNFQNQVEDKKRGDMAQVQQMLMDTYGLASGNANQQAAYQMQTPNMLQTMGQGIGAGLTAYGALQGGQQGNNNTNGGGGTRGAVTGPGFPNPMQPPNVGQLQTPTINPAQQQQRRTPFNG